MARVPRHGTGTYVSRRFGRGRFSSVVADRCPSAASLLYFLLSFHVPVFLVFYALVYAAGPKDCVSIARPAGHIVR